MLKVPEHFILSLQNKGKRANLECKKCGQGLYFSVDIGIDLDLVGYFEAVHECLKEKPGRP